MIGEVVKGVRLRHSLTQSDLASQLEVTKSYICKVEKGALTPSEGFLKELALLYDLDEDELLIKAGMMPSRMYAAIVEKLQMGLPCSIEIDKDKVSEIARFRPEQHQASKPQWLEDRIKSFAEMSVAELQKEIEQLETDLRSIKDQFRAANERFRLGEPIDRDWEKKAKRAKISKGILLQAASREIRRKYKDSALRFDRFFREVAKEMLPEEVFQRIEGSAIKDVVAENIRREKERSRGISDND